MDIHSDVSIPQHVLNLVSEVFLGIILYGSMANSAVPTDTNKRAKSEVW